MEERIRRRRSRKRRTRRRSGKAWWQKCLALALQWEGGGGGKKLLQVPLIFNSSSEQGPPAATPSCAGCQPRMLAGSLDASAACFFPAAPLPAAAEASGQSSSLQEGGPSALLSCRLGGQSTAPPASGSGRTCLPPAQRCAPVSRGSDCFLPSPSPFQS